MKPDGKPRILVVEDEPDIAYVISRHLKEKLSAITVIAPDCSSAVELLSRGSFDAVTMNVQLPDGGGLELLQRIRRMTDPPPVVMVTGHDDEVTARKSFEMGASGFVVKDKKLPNLLPQTVSKALDEHAFGKAREDLRLVSDALRESQRELQAIFDTVPALIFYTNGENRALRVNEQFAEALGLSKEEIEGKNPSELLPDLAEDYYKNDLEVLRSGKPRLGIIEPMQTPAGERWYRTDKIPYRDVDGNVTGVVGFSVDITEQRKAAEKLAENEQKYSALFRQSPVGIFTYGIDMVVTDCNQRFAEIMSSSTDRIIGLDLTKLREKRVIPNLHEALDGKVSSYEGPYQVTTSEAFLHVTFVISPLRDVSGNVIGGIGAVEDITQRVKAEEALRQSEMKYRGLAESLPEVVFEIDGSGIITYVNENALEMFGYSREDVSRGLTVSLLAALEDRRRIAGDFRELMRGRLKTASGEYLALRKDGTTFPCIVYSTPVVGDEGNPTGIRGILADISERKKWSEDLERANAELKAYAHSVSHDLKGPLASTAISADVLEKMLTEKGVGDDPDVLETLSIIKRNAVRASMRVESLLALAEAGQAPVNATTVDVASIVNEVVGEMSSLTGDSGFEVAVGNDLGLLKADPTHLHQVFSNLIGNAIAHNDSDGLVVEVRRLDNHESGAHGFLVRDNGGGIPEEVLMHMFLPFAKGEKSSGTGVGLSLVDKVVRVYGGSIRAYNDNGACIELTLYDYER